MGSRFARPAFTVLGILAAAGIAAVGLALRPALAGGSLTVGPFAIVSCTNSSPCQWYKNAGTGPGLHATNTNTSAGSSGLIGTSTHGGAGVTGTSVAGNGVYGSGANSGVWGTGGSSGVFGYSKSGTGIYGQSSTAYGAFGRSDSSIGVSGESYSSYGVFGFSETGVGIEGASHTSIAMKAFSQSSAAALDAVGGTGDAIDATTNGGIGVYVHNTGGNGADVTGTFFGVVGRAPNCTSGSGYPIVATDQNGSNLMFVDCSGAVWAHNGYGTFLSTSIGKIATSYVPAAASPTVEDNGTSHLSDGVAVVQLDRTFAAAVDMRRPYQVMLTPDGDTKGLFVSAKTPTSFVVREVQGGRGSLDFDYHIYASTLGHLDERMTAMTPAQLGAREPRAPVIRRISPTLDIPAPLH